MTNKPNKALTEQHTRLLKPGDRLILDVIAGSRALAKNAADVTRYLQSHGLKHGETYTFMNKQPIYKSGEGTLRGWYINVMEQAGEPKVQFEYYAVTPDLEAKLAERRNMTE